MMAGRANRIRCCWTALLLAAGWSVFPAWAVDWPARVEQPAAIAQDVLPPGYFAVVELRDAHRLIGELQSSELVRDLATGDRWKSLRERDDVRKAVAGLRIVQAQLGVDAWAALKFFTGRRLVVGLYPPESGREPLSVIALHSPRTAAPEPLVQRATDLLQLFGQPANENDAASERYRTPDGMLIDWRGDWIVASKQESLLRTTVDAIRNSSTGETRTANGGQAAMGAGMFQAGEAGRVEVNLKAIRDAVGGRYIPQLLDNPLASLLLGHVLESGATSDRLTARLTRTDAGLSLAVEVDGKIAALPEQYQAFRAGPLLPRVDWSRLPGLLGQFELDRDWVAWYRARERLLDPKVLPEFDKFESGLNNILPSKDFSTDVLPQFGRSLTLVVAEPDYSHLPRPPAMRLPAAALVAELSDEKKGGDIGQLVFQTVLSIGNLTAAEQKRQPWVMAGETYRGAALSYGRYLSVPEGQELGTAYNFAPASAVVGKRFVLASSSGLCRKLIDLLTDEGTALARTDAPVRDASGSRDLLLAAFPSESRALIEQNRALLLARSLQNGQSNERAQTDLELLLELLKRASRIELRTGPAASGGAEARLELKLN